MMVVVAQQVEELVTAPDVPAVVTDGDASGESGESGLRKGATFALVSLGIFSFMSTLDGSIVNVALPTMARELAVPSAQITWIVTIYLITISSMLLVFGRLADLLGKTRVTKAGWLVFIIGSFLCGLDIGLGLPFLLFARVIQGLGAAMFMATSFGLISELFPVAGRAQALAMMSMFVSLGAIAGPAVGGLLLQIATWPYIFWINVPIGLAALIFGMRVLPSDNRHGSIRDLDRVGALLMTLTIVSLFLGLNFGSSLGWTNPFVLGGIVLAIVLLVLFIRYENRSASPLLDLHIFQNALWRMSVITALLNFTAQVFPSILLPFYLQDFRQYSAGQAGLIMMAFPAAMLIASPIAGRIADRKDKELITFIGICGIVLAQISYLFLGAGSPRMQLVATLALYGAAMGFFQSPNNALIMETVDRKYLGIAGSVNALARNSAYVLGTTLATAAAFTAMSIMHGSTVATYPADEPLLFVRGMHIAFFVSLALVVTAWLLSLIRLAKPHARKRGVAIDVIDEIEAEIISDQGGMLVDESL